MNKQIATKYLAFLSMTDGSLYLHKGCVNASFHIIMKKSNFDFVEQYAIPCLEYLKIGYKVRESKCGKYKGVDSRVHPFLTKLYERIYVHKKQSPSAHDIKQMDWEAMAIMYMADGSIQKSGKVWYPMLNLCAYSYPELCWLKQKIKERLDVDVNIYRCGKYFRYGVPRKDVDVFFDGVRPYMVDSFKYKLSDGKPQLG